VRGAAELLEQEVANKWVDLVAAGLGAEEAQFLGFGSECICVVAQKLFERRRLEIRSKCDPQESMLDLCARRLEELFREVRVEEPGGELWVRGADATGGRGQADDGRPPLGLRNDVLEVWV